MKRTMKTLSPEEDDTGGFYFDSFLIIVSTNQSAIHVVIIVERLRFAFLREKNQENDRI